MTVVLTINHILTERHGVFFNYYITAEVLLKLLRTPVVKISQIYAYILVGLFLGTLASSVDHPGIPNDLIVAEKEVTRFCILK